MTAEDEQYRERLVAWADQVRSLPGWTREQIFANLGKGKGRGKMHWLQAGVKPSWFMRVLRKRALAELLARMPAPPFKYAGVEMRRPGTVLYMDGV